MTTNVVTKKKRSQLGQRVRATRKRLGLTVPQLGAQLAMSKTTITRLELGTSDGSDMTEATIDRFKAFVADPTTSYDNALRQSHQAKKINGDLHRFHKASRRSIDASSVAGSGLSLIFPWVSLDDQTLLTLILDATTEMMRRRQEQPERSDLRSWDDKETSASSTS